jgi:hypothetical protein
MKRLLYLQNWKVYSDYCDFRFGMPRNSRLYAELWTFRFCGRWQSRKLEWQKGTQTAAWTRWVHRKSLDWTRCVGSPWLATCICLAPFCHVIWLGVIASYSVLPEILRGIPYNRFFVWWINCVICVAFCWPHKLNPASLVNMHGYTHTHAYFWYQ